MIIRIENHPSDRDFLLAHTPPDLAHAMGRFAAARFVPKLKAYVIRAEHLDQLRLFARHEGASVLDERDTSSAEKFSGPLPECRSCGQPASRKAALTLNRCQACGDAWHPVVFQDPGSAASMRVDCPGCGRRQQGGFAFCGECGAAMPVPVGAGPRAVDLPGRPVDQDPLPDPRSFADCIEELALPMTVDGEEVSDREWYP